MSRAQSGFDADAAYVWFVGHRAHILLLDVAYALFIWKGGRFMSKHRLSRTFIDDVTMMWNGFNAVVSIYLTLCLLPEFLTAFLAHGWYYTICKTNQLYTGAWSGWGMYAFCLSKIWELGDTILLMVRGRDIIFLHVYHHFVVLLQTTLTYRDAGAIARLGTMMNVAIHSVMYSYFVVQNFCPKVRRYAPLITILQLLQFVVGCSAILSAFGYMARGKSCETERSSLLIHFFVYLSFFVLFTNFFYRSFVQRRRHVSGNVRRSRSHAKND